MKIENYTPEILKIAGDTAQVLDWKERQSSIWNALKFERSAFRFIFSFVVLIATMNIVSGLVMLVKNKTRDVAILRTIGADRYSILRIFFMAGTMIGVAGTLVGFLLGVVFVLNIHAIQTGLEYLFHIKIFDPKVYFLSQVPAKLDVGEVVTVVLGSLIASCGCTLFPAFMASRLEPIEALRNE